LALWLSGYTAHLQSWQVRGPVWPILEYNTSNAPDIPFALANKAVGVAGPVRDWRDAFDKIARPRKRSLHRE
jgi:hypothetical protein